MTHAETPHYENSHRLETFGGPASIIGALAAKVAFRLAVEYMGLKDDPKHERACIETGSRLGYQTLIQLDSLISELFPTPTN